MKELQFTKESEFIPIKELLAEDNEKIKEIKSLFQREVEYVSFLGPIESFFAYFYLDNLDTKDSDIEKAIKNIKMNYYKLINDFNIYLEKELIGVISEILKQNIKHKRKITRHELFLVLNYILWSIDNRKHLGDKQAYLKWICNYFNILPSEEKKEFDKFYDDYGKKKGLSKKDISVLKNDIDEDEEIPINEAVLSKIDSEIFSENEDGEYQFWENGSFVESIKPEELEEKLKTINKKHDEDVNFNCKKCGRKISAHSKDWHDGLCDKCFYESHY